jgi:hypothetical protein
MALYEGAMIGGALGTVFPGVGNVVGTVVGGLIGGGIDLFNFFTGASAQAQKQDVDLTYQIATTKLQVAEAQAKKEAYESFLSKIPVAGQALTGSTGDPEFDRQYRALLENFGTLNVLAGATGRVGPGTSMALVQEQAQGDVTGFVDTQTEIAQRQLDLYNTTIETLNPALTTMEEVKEHPDLLTGIGNWLNTGKWKASGMGMASGIRTG